ncbi:MAG: hypothetical protein ACOX2X_08875 [Peptococcia bacterium]|jgi:hypothetical protein
MGILDSFSKRAKKEPGKQILNTQQLTFSFWTPGGSDGCPVALELAGLLAEVTKEKTALVELPCLGIPRLALHVDLYDKEKNTDKLLLDLERSEYRDVYPAQYLLPLTDLIAVMVNNPYATPDLPLNLKLNNLETLTDFPRYLRKNLLLEGYKYVIFVLQGQIHHPLTFFALRESAPVVFNVNFPIELGWCLSCFNKLTESYNERPEKFALYSTVLDSKTIARITSLRYLKSIEEMIYADDLTACGKKEER